MRQHMDRFNAIGRPKTKSSARTLPVGPAVIKTLKEWRLACPKGKANLVFPDQNGEFFRRRAIICAMFRSRPASFRALVDQSMGGMPFAISVRVG